LILYRGKLASKPVRGIVIAVQCQQTANLAQARRLACDRPWI